MPKKLFLIDGSNHAFRVQFALPPQHASDGFPTRVLYGFTLLFQKMMRTYRPDWCVVSFDSAPAIAAFGRFRIDHPANHAGPTNPMYAPQAWSGVTSIACSPVLRTPRAGGGMPWSVIHFAAASMPFVR